MSGLRDMSMQERDEFLQELDYLVGDENPEKVLSFIKKLKNLTVVSDGERLRYWEDIVSYVEGMIHGDDIQQYLSYTYLTKYAQVALKKMISEVHDETLESYRREKRLLERDVLELIQNKDGLLSSVSELSEKAGTLKEQVGRLSAELYDVMKNLEDVQANGMKRVEDSVRDRKVALEEEIEHLVETKGVLSSSIEELKRQLTNLNLRIASLDGQERVVWKPLEANDPIYNTSHKTIGPYFEALYKIYCEKMDVDLETAKEEFSKHCPGVGALDETLASLANFDYPSINALFKQYRAEKLTAACDKKVEAITAILRTMKMPHYLPQKTKADKLAVKSETVANSVDVLLRELHFQRVAIEAMAKQRVAEAELQVVVNVLKHVLPEGFDLSSLGPIALSSETLQMISEGTTPSDEETRLELRM